MAHGARSGRRRARRMRSRPAALLAAVFVALLFVGLSAAVPSMRQSLGIGPAAPSADRGGWTEWDPQAYPDYYRVVGEAEVDLELEPGEVRYEGLDELGRTGRVAALVTPEMAEAGSEREREDISDIHPSGWGHNEEVAIQMPDGSTYHGYLFNRSHLLAKSLGGDDADYNLVTGTRTQNVGDNRGQDGGMAYTEGLARDWLRSHPDGTIYYSAAPVYEGSELVPRSVIVDVRSSDGELDLEVEVFNAALGYDIDYATGSFSAAGE